MSLGVRLFLQPILLVKLPDLELQCFAHRDWNLSFLTFWSITQPYYMLCMWETYQHDPQSLLIKTIRLISGQVTVT